MRAESIDNLYGIKSSINRVLSQKTLDRACFLSVVILTGLWAFLTFDKAAPVSEGWYVVYSEMILAGKTPYIDFELLYPPLYTYMCTAFIVIFGDSLLAFRTMGALIFIFIAFFSYFMFKEFVPSWVAAVGAMITAFALQADVFYVSYDYQSFFILFAYISGFLTLKLIIKRYRGQDINIGLNLFIIGITCAIATLIRPQSGVILLVYFILSFVFVNLFLKTIKFDLREMCYFSAGLVIPIFLNVVLLIYLGALTPAIEMIFFGGSKGSISSMLFGWFPLLLENLYLTSLLLIPYLMIIIIKRNKDVQIQSDKLDYLVYFVLTGIIAILIILMFVSLDLSLGISRYHPLLQVSIFILGIVITLTLMFKVLTTSVRMEQPSYFDIANLFLYGFALTIAYGIFTSGGSFAYIGVALIFGLIVITILSYSIERPKTNVKRVVKVLSLFFVVFIIVTNIAPKVVEPRSWWGDSTSPYQLCVYETDIEYFKGIKLSAEEKYMYEDFVEKASLYLEIDDEIYCYASIPIFYTLAGKVPQVKCPVPWFDVSQTSTIYEDLAYLKKNNPKMIIFSDHTISGLEFHEYLYGSKPAHRELYNWLIDCKNGLNGYKVISEYYGAFTTYLMVLD